MFHLLYSRLWTFERYQVEILFRWYYSQYIYFVAILIPGVLSVCSRCSACYCWSAWPWPSALLSSSTTLRNSSTTTSTPGRNWGSCHFPGSTSTTAPCTPWREPSSPTDRSPTPTTSTVSIIHDQAIICRLLTLRQQQLGYLNILHNTQTPSKLTALRYSAIIMIFEYLVSKYINT